MNSAVSLTSREEIEVHRFSWPVSIGIPVLAIFLQVFLRVRFLTVLDLPLLVTIFFAVAIMSQAVSTSASFSLSKTPPSSARADW